MKHFLIFIILLTFIACNSTKKPKKEEVKEKNTTTISSAIEASNSKELIVKKELNAYLKELSTFNTDAIVDMTYPKLFDVIDLDLYRQYIASMMNSTDIEIKSYESKVTKLSPVTIFSNATKFAQVDYESKIKIHLLNKKLYNTEEKINFLYDALIHKYGKENIRVDIKKRILSIKKSEKLLMIKEKDKKWKFLGDNSKYRQLYPNFLPIEIWTLINK
ncbi:MAG: Unknown protein [uncultured Sulfurovum sp.]|uniref:Lipoprotein n=1 Tax=uncultured Sulfurovum sp. TaxID=269237 RepID=A0A6S6TDP5_9BACT|nr:MAG: Unknown protein [uncultured Sulfurovum sp.]